MFNVREGLTAFELGRTSTPEQFKKGLASSKFAPSVQRAQLDEILGAKSAVPVSADKDDEATALGNTYDGTTPAAEVTYRDQWRALNAPLQSREGRRSAKLYEQVINQFAVANNPRYEPDESGRSRAHIFVWDVTRAMNAEVPHFVGSQELTLTQTCDWLRHEGPLRGWYKAEQDRAQGAANQGRPVIALPRDPLVTFLGIVRPGALGPDGKPRLAAAGLVCGNDVGPREAFGVMALDYYVHA